MWIRERILSPRTLEQLASGVFVVVFAVIALVVVLMVVVVVDGRTCRCGC